MAKEKFYRLQDLKWELKKIEYDIIGQKELEEILEKHRQKSNKKGGEKK